MNVSQREKEILFGMISGVAILVVGCVVFNHGLRFTKVHIDNLIWVGMTISALGIALVGFMVYRLINHNI